jgi:hypothetical protein
MCKGALMVFCHQIGKGLLILDNGLLLLINAQNTTYAATLTK